MIRALATLVLFSKGWTDTPLPKAFDGHQPPGCTIGQNKDDHLWYTTVNVTFPEPNPETNKYGIWEHHNYYISDTKEKGEKACNKWLDAVHKLVKERYK